MLINNRYQIQKLLGRGGFGQTYLAFDTQCFNHPCVLKEFAPASRAEYAMKKARELFEREARVLYAIDHPQIPKFLAWFVDQGRIFLVQEYIAGKTYAQLLHERQQRGQAFSEGEVIRWLIDLLPVLDYLHQRQMVHRDISPDNLMLPERENARPVLIDFGLVKQTLSQIYAEAGSRVLEPASFVGKFGYAPPEQIRLGHCFPSSDLYALGVTALVLLTSREPRSLLDQESLEWHWQDYVLLSPPLVQVLTQMLQEKPRNRYQTAQEVLNALQPIFSTTPSNPSVALHSTASQAFSPAALSPTALSPTTLSPTALSPTALSPTTLSPAAVGLPDLNPAFLQQCQQELMSRIGPIAPFVLENALTQSPHPTPAQLIAALALEIPDPTQAKSFKASLAALVHPSALNPALPSPAQSQAQPQAPLPVQGQSQPHSSAMSPAPSNATNSKAPHPSRSRALEPATGTKRASAPVPTLSPAFLQQCQQALTRCIGPVATVILEDLLSHDPHITPEELVEAIASEIPNLQQAEAFRKLMG